MTGEYRLVPVEILDRFPEINPSNYDHDDACALNEWGVEVVLASVSIPPAGNVVIAQEPKNSGAPVTLTYRNYRGEVAERTITPKRVWFGSTEWHLEPQWLLTVFDHDKQVDRDFTLKDVGAAIPAAPVPPPADLMERAKDFTVKWGRSDSSISTQAVAAFAAEYAAGREKAAEDAYFAAAKKRGQYRERAEAAEHALEEKTIAYSRAMESRQHWRERAEIAERTKSDLIKAALVEEREACAKIAEGWPCEACGDKYQTAGNGDFWDAGGIYDQGRLDAAAAIRARKGDTHE